MIHSPIQSMNAVFHGKSQKVNSVGGVKTACLSKQSEALDHLLCGLLLFFFSPGQMGAPHSCRQY